MERVAAARGLGRFRRERSPARRDRFRAFAADSRHAHWLGDWELYRALKDRHGGAQWHGWPAPLARRETSALASARRELVAETGYHRFAQFVFFSQWSRLRGGAARRGIRLLGDLPIYVAHDSADVWAHPELFDLDERGLPSPRRRRARRTTSAPPASGGATRSTAGTAWPPTATAWWIDRLRGSLELTDRVRIDHFRGFAAYWADPGERADGPRRRNG